MGVLGVSADVKRESRLGAHSLASLGHLFTGLGTLGVNREVQFSYDL